MYIHACTFRILAPSFLFKFWRHYSFSFVWRLVIGRQPIDLMIISTLCRRATNFSGCPKRILPTHYCFRSFASRKEKREEKMSANNTSILHEMSGELYSSVKIGLVIERHGAKLLVEDNATRQVRECGQRNTLQREHIVCGDQVSYQLVKASTARGARYQQEGLVVGRGVRRNLLYRPDPLHRAAKKIKVCVIFIVGDTCLL
jgi:hypothetical protein